MSLMLSAVRNTFDEIDRHTSRTAITTLLADLFAQADPEEVKIISYLSLSLLRAPYEGTFFNLADKSVIKVLAHLLGISQQEVETKEHQLGDLGLVAATGAWHDGDLSLVQVYADLVAIEKTSGIGSQEKKADLLLQLFNAVDPRSACYLVRIVLGTLRLGFSDMTIIDALSWMVVGNKKLRGIIEHAYNIVADIGLIGFVLKKEGIAGLEHIKIQPGIPIRPAAAERLPNALAIFDKLGPCIAQPKLDGFRLQVHVKCDEHQDQEHKQTCMTWFFSRNLHNMSNMFPELKAALAQVPVATLIVEGEAIGYNEETGEFVTFQETVKRKRKHAIEETARELPLKLFLFDILYSNGESLLKEPYYERRKRLIALFPPDHHHTAISAVDEKVITQVEELENYYQKNITAGLEGIVVKRTDAPYQPGKRNFNWIKLKRHAEGELEDTIDAVILGYYFGSGKRAAFGIGAFLVGVYDTSADRLVTVAKVGTGLTDAGWKDLKQRCDALKLPEAPSNVLCPPELRPDVWIAPTIVCALRADEITQSPLHSAGKTDKELGFALRFPRFIDYRPDKSPEQATTVDELRALYAHQFKRS
jgi:DNA ligase 1